MLFSVLNINEEGHSLLLPAKVLLLMEPQFLFGGNDRLTVGLFPVTFVTFFFICVINPAVAGLKHRQGKYPCALPRDLPKTLF